VLELAAQAVVERDEAGAFGQRAAVLDRRDEVVPGDELKRAPEDLELGGEVAGRDGEDRPWRRDGLRSDVVVTDCDEDDAR
jgi:hypothetical protein